jgi:hypothetical protein
LPTKSGKSSIRPFKRQYLARLIIDSDVRFLFPNRVLFSNFELFLNLELFPNLELFSNLELFPNHEHPVGVFVGRRKSLGLFGAGALRWRQCLLFARLAVYPATAAVVSGFELQRKAFSVGSENQVLLSRFGQGIHSQSLLMGQEFVVGFHAIEIHFVAHHMGQNVYVIFGEFEFVVFAERQAFGAIFP